MIEAAVFTFCKCCMKPAEECRNNPPPELLYEVEVKLKDVTRDAYTRSDRVDVGA